MPWRRWLLEEMNLRPPTKKHRREVQEEVIWLLGFPVTYDLPGVGEQADIIAHGEIEIVSLKTQRTPHTQWYGRRHCNFVLKCYASLFLFQSYRTRTPFWFVVYSFVLLIRIMIITLLFAPCIKTLMTAWNVSFQTFIDFDGWHKFLYCEIEMSRGGIIQLKVHNLASR